MKLAGRTPARGLHLDSPVIFNVSAAICEETGRGGLRRRRPALGSTVVAAAALADGGASEGRPVPYRGGVQVVHAQPRQTKWAKAKCLPVLMKN